MERSGNSFVLAEAKVMAFDKKLHALAELVTKERTERLMVEAKGTPVEHYGFNDIKILHRTGTTIKHGKKYVKIDVGYSGFLMIDKEGNIFGIKAYGVIHRGHHYGTLDTIDQYYWGGYSPSHK